MWNVCPKIMSGRVKAIMNQAATVRKQVCFLLTVSTLEKAFQEKGMCFSVAAVFQRPFIKQ